jgi:hypothetical protein
MIVKLLSLTERIKQIITPYFRDKPLNDKRNEKYFSFTNLLSLKENAIRDPFWIRQDHLPYLLLTRIPFGLADFKILALAITD